MRQVSTKGKLGGTCRYAGHVRPQVRVVPRTAYVLTGLFLSGRGVDERHGHCEAAYMYTMEVEVGGGLRGMLRECASIFRIYMEFGRPPSVRALS